MAENEHANATRFERVIEQSLPVRNFLECQPIHLPKGGNQPF